MGEDSLVNGNGKRCQAGLAKQAVGEMRRAGKLNVRVTDGNASFRMQVVSSATVQMPE